ncbi:hypothetical protein C494_09074 [Natronorubrum bangense JCM 10635]|uniref:Uncharacterized protein n=1 Tax=Natronorubrum bangense JCM 10635 TaxID=1227500 RepID=L9WI83_9EURY|nr:hypothetical protein C494_09074 [Natronorubrum bangense JCM 10635]
MIRREVSFTHVFLQSIAECAIVEARVSENHSTTADSRPFAEQQRLFKLGSEADPHPTVGGVEVG